MNIKINILTSLLLVVFISIPMHANIVILNGLTHIHNGELNDQLTGEILIKNTDTKKEHSFLLYLEDLDQNCTNNLYLKAGEHQRSLKEWISINTYEKTLAPNEEFSIEYSIEISKKTNVDSLYNGTFWSVIMLEGTTPIKKESKENSIQFLSKIRYAIQIIASIGETINSEIEFVNIKVDEEDGIHTLFAEIENKSIYIVHPELILEIFDELGETIEAITIPARKIYPHSCKKFNIQIPKIPKGEYYATLIANYDNEMYGAELCIEIKDD